MQLLNNQTAWQERHSSDVGGIDAGNSSMQQLQQQDPTQQLLVSGTTVPAVCVHLL
jgi:hypothetical protein